MHLGTWIHHDPASTACDELGFVRRFLGFTHWLFSQDHELKLLTELRKRKTWETMALSRNRIRMYPP